MTSISKQILVGTLALALAIPCLAQTPAGSSAAPAQQMNSVQFTRLFGGLNATPLSGPLPVNPAVGLGGGNVAGTGLSNSEMNVGPNTTTPGFVSPQTGRFQMGQGLPGTAVAAPGTIVQGAANPVLQQMMAQAAFNRAFGGLSTGMSAGITPQASVITSAGGAQPRTGLQRTLIPQQTTTPPRPPGGR
jgi:hypothetical protein